MDHPITLTPFEEQVLELLARTLAPPVESAGSLHIHFQGAQKYGDEWGGPEIYRKKVIINTNTPKLVNTRYPQIDMALGRLAKKGLVTRFENQYFTNRGSDLGMWKLTDQGKILLGIA